MNLRRSSSGSSKEESESVSSPSELVTMTLPFLITRWEELKLAPCDAGIESWRPLSALLFPTPALCPGELSGWECGGGICGEGKEVERESAGGGELWFCFLEEVEGALKKSAMLRD